MEKSINRQDLEERILKYMAAHNTISLATATDGQPHAATVFYVSIGLELFFVSNPTSRHSVNLEQNPIVSGTINEDYSNWLKIKKELKTDIDIEYGGRMRLIIRRASQRDGVMVRHIF